MSDFNIEVEGGSSVRLPTGGKYCPKDIIVTAKGGGSAGGGGMDAYIEGATTEVNSSAARIADNVFRNNILIKSVNLPNATSIGSYAFSGCSKLLSADIPIATTIGNQAFYNCQKLERVNFQSVGTQLPNQTFYNCYALTDVKFTNVNRTNQEAFYNCKALTSADFSKLAFIASYTFENCYSLKSVILRSETICTLEHTVAFKDCYHILGTVNSTYNPNGDKDGYIYVPASLVDTYKAATNWSAYASQIVAIPGEESTKLPTPTIMVDIGDLYINDYGNATTATLYWSGNGTNWDYLTDFDLTTGETQHVVSYDALVSWLDEYAGVTEGYGSLYLSVITHADGYESSERSNSDILAL